MLPKLIRNLIPQIIIQKENTIPLFHKATDEEYWIRLKEKLVEEVNEFLQSEQNEEIADILEVIDAIINVKQVSMRDILLLKEKKRETNGSFSDQLILTEVKKG